MSSAALALTRAARAVSTRVASIHAELLHAGAIVVGWTLVTWGIASLLEVWQVWPLSGGLFLLSLAGWGALRELFSRGLYFLTRRPE